MSSSYKCLIVDDESLARELIAAHLDQLPDFELVASCASAIEASQIVKETHIDLMFLDIEMPVLKGNDFYQNLRIKPKVIFTTAYRDYAIDGFELDAVDYLLKPIVFARFFQAIEKFLALKSLSSDNNSKQAPRDHFFIRADRKQVKIALQDVLYIKSLKDYVQIFCKEQSHVTKMTMTEISKRLNSSFVQVHRSYIVNQDRITAFTQHDIEIGELEIPIGDKYRHQLQF